MTVQNGKILHRNFSKPESPDYQISIDVDEISLPSGYHGPVHYLVHGPDIELLFGFPPRKPVASRGVPVEPVVGLRVFLREHRPLGLEEQDDLRPHLTAGAGVEFGLRVGG